MIAKIIILVVLILCLMVASLILFGTWRDHELRTNIQNVQVGMSSKEVIAILGEPTEISISDIPGTYWSYQPKPLKSFSDPFNEGYLVLEMGANQKVVKVFPLETK